MDRINLLIIILIAFCATRLEIINSENEIRDAQRLYITMVMNEEVADHRYIVNGDDLEVICFDGIPNKAFNLNSIEMDGVWVNLIDTELFKRITWMDKDTTITLE